MQEFRCKQCGKLLAKIEGNVTTIPNEILDHITNSEEIDKDTVKLQIKCPRQHCKTINEIIV